MSRFIALDQTTGRFYVCDGVTSWPLTPARLAKLRTWRDWGLLRDIASDRNHPEAGSTLEFPVIGWNQEEFGTLVRDTPPVAPVVAAQIDPVILQGAVEAALRAVGVSVSPAQVAAALEYPAVRAVLVAAAEEGSNLAEDD